MIMICSLHRLRSLHRST